MSNRSISMYEYRQVIMSLRLGESCRSIAKAGLIGRHKAEQIRQLAMEHDWLNSDTLLPDDAVLAELLLKHKPQPQVKYQFETMKRKFDSGQNKSSKQAPSIRPCSVNMVLKCSSSNLI